jgi:hypothetical protein
LWEKIGRYLGDAKELGHWFAVVKSRNHGSDFM